MPMRMTIPKNAIIFSEDIVVQAKVPSQLPAEPVGVLHKGMITGQRKNKAEFKLTLFELLQPSERLTLWSKT